MAAESGIKSGTVNKEPHMKKWAKKSLVGLAVAAALGVAGAAQAAALADAILLINSLTFTDTNGVILANGTNVSVISNSGSAAALATLGATTIANSVPTGTQIDIPVQCLGSNCGTDARLANNAFGIFTHGADPTTNTAAADANEHGSPISGVPAAGGGTLATPANIGNSALAQIASGTVAGSSNSTNGFTAQFSFIADVTGAIQVRMNASAYLEAFASPTFGTSANAAISNSFTLTDVTNPLATVLVFAWAPDGAGGGIIGGTQQLDPFSLNANVGALGPAGGQQIGNTVFGATRGAFLTGNFQATTPILIAGHTYTVAANNGAQAQAQNAAPEPGSLFLLGSGLLGLWGMRRRSVNS
jgi:hypothetical protein